MNDRLKIFLASGPDREFSISFEPAPFSAFKLRLISRELKNDRIVPGLMVSECRVDLLDWTIEKMIDELERKIAELGTDSPIADSDLRIAGGEGGS